MISLEKRQLFALQSSSLSPHMADDIDHDFFDSPGRSLGSALGKYTDEPYDTDRQSVTSSARSTTSSVRIEARIPSVSRDSFGSDSDSDRSHEDLSRWKPPHSKTGSRDHDHRNIGKIFSRTDKRPPMPTKSVSKQRSRKKSSSRESSPERLEGYHSGSDSSNDTYTLSRPENTEEKYPNRCHSRIRRNSSSSSASEYGDDTVRRRTRKSSSASHSDSNSSQWSTGRQRLNI